MTVELFKGQDFRLQLNTGIDLTGASVTNILYKSPTSKTGVWTGTVTGKSIFHDVTPLENNEAGTWYYQVYVEQSGKKYYGQMVSKVIFKTNS